MMVSKFVATDAHFKRICLCIEMTLTSKEPYIAKLVLYIDICICINIMHILCELHM